jgi:RNA polymerase sigma-70 factor (ECF subfamily)
LLLREDSIVDPEEEEPWSTLTRASGGVSEIPHSLEYTEEPARDSYRSENAPVTVDAAFEELYRREFGSVYRACYLLAGDAGLAEEAAQEAFARCLARWRRLRDQPWVAGWVTTTAMNHVRRTLRRRRREPSPPSTQPQARDLADHLDLVGAIRALPPRQQEAVILHYGMGLTVADVGSAMGCAEGTVKAHLAKARAGLRTRLEVSADEH